jgi:transcriptional regulator with XRE-family HTH domain
MKSARDSRTGPEAAATVAAWRAQVGWTQQRAADELGMHRVNFSRIERGVIPVQRVVLLAMSALANGMDEWRAD